MYSPRTWYGKPLRKDRILLRASSDLEIPIVWTVLYKSYRGYIERVTLRIEPTSFIPDNGSWADEGYYVTRELCCDNFATKFLTDDAVTYAEAIEVVDAAIAEYVL